MDSSFNECGAWPTLCGPSSLRHTNACETSNILMAEKSKETKTKLYKIGEIRQYKHGTGVNFFYSENSAISLNILESLGKGVKEAI